MCACPQTSSQRGGDLQRILISLAVAGLTLHCAPARAQSTIPPANTDGAARAVAQHAGLEGRVLWLDGTANLQRLSSRDGVAAVLDRCVKANINTVVVDVKPLSGHVLYDSKLAPRLKEWRGVRNPDGYDLLRTALEEGRRRNLKIYANINVFSDGHKLVRSGPGYDKPDQQSLVYEIQRTVVTPRGDRRVLAIGANEAPQPGEISLYEPDFRQPRVIEADEAFVLVIGDRVEAVVDGTFAPAGGVTIPADGFLLVGKGEGARWLTTCVRVGDTLNWAGNDRLIPIADAPSEKVGIFLNPANPAVREYELKIVEELISNYDFDGIVFDRMRFSSLQSDFSDLTRQKFEEYVGQKLNRWPGDVYAFDPTPGKKPVRGAFFQQWLEFRARTIKTWLEEASQLVRSRRSDAKIGVYVGSWYGSYYTVGVNWGSEEFMPGYEWMSPTYNTTGYAHLLDWITTGCYHPVATREQARNAGIDDNYTVQAAAELSTRAVGDQAFVYAGVYVQDYKGAPEAFRESMRAARQYSQGVMIFDLSQLEDYGYWPILEDEFKTARTAPHDVQGLVDSVRALRKALSAAGRSSVP